MNLARMLISSVVLATATISLSTTARSNEEEFYRGKTMSLIIPIGPGGIYDVFGRMVAKHLGKFIPGNPTIVPRNMPGAGGVIATNHVYNVAPQDGTTLIIITSTFAIEQLLDTPQIKYDARRFQAIGRLTDTTSTVVFWHTSPIKNATDLLAKPTVVAVSSMNEIFAARFVLMNRLLGANIKLVPGYPSSKDYYLASQRGETEGFWIPFITLKQFYSADLAEKKLNVVLQSATVRENEMQYTPTMLELSNDPEVKQIFRHLGSNDEIGRSLFTTPAVPAARVAVLRSAFQNMQADRAFREEAEKLRLPLSPRSGDEIQKVVLGTFDTSPSLLAKIRELTKQ